MRDIEKDLELCAKALKLPHYRITSDDWEFIAAAREALPWYIGEVKRLRATSVTLSNKIIELEERLRPGSPTERAPTTWAYENACEALQRRHAENKDLRAKNQRLREGLERVVGEQKDTIVLLCADNDKLRAENQRLREALESISLCRCPGANEPVCVHEIAKKALEVAGK